MNNSVEYLRNFFEPASVALVGASDNPLKPQFYLLKNLLDLGYPGRVFPVNPRLKELMGQKVYPDVTSLPGPVDVAMIVVPSQAVPQTVAECGRKGVKAVIIGGGGFSEKGPAGQALMDETMAAARQFGLRFMGPNSIGATNPRIKFTTAFIDAPLPRPGPISFITQTGLVGGPLLHWINSIAKTACLGNRVDIDADEVLSYLADDPETKVIGVHSEGFNHPARFVQAAKKCRRAGKPVVLLTAGQSAQGAKIASSHTGSMGADHSMLLAAARQAGTILVDDLDTFFLTLEVTAEGLRVKPPFKLAIVSVSGAVLVMAGDACAQLGLDIAPAQGPGTCLPGQALYDVGSWSGDLRFGELIYETTRQALSQAAVTHCLVYLAPTPRLFNLDPQPIFTRLRDEFPGKAILPCIFGHRQISAEWSQVLENIGLPCHSSLDRILEALARHQSWLKRNIP